jgi:hypothetical protein
MWRTLETRGDKMQETANMRARQRQADAADRRMQQTCSQPDGGDRLTEKRRSLAPSSEPGTLTHPYPPSCSSLAVLSCGLADLNEASVGVGMMT